MRRDTGSRTEADAGRWEAAHADRDDDRPTRSELLADEYGAGVTPRRKSLVDEVRSAIVWSGAARTTTRDVRMTAAGVAAFPVVDGDDVDKLVAWFGYEGLDTRVVEHDGTQWMYARHGEKLAHPAPWAPAATATQLDPWQAQDEADKGAERATESRETA